MKNRIIIYVDLDSLIITEKNKKTTQKGEIMNILIGALAALGISFVASLLIEWFDKKARENSEKSKK